MLVRARAMPRSFAVASGSIYISSFHLFCARHFSPPVEAGGKTDVMMLCPLWLCSIQHFGLSLSHSLSPSPLCNISYLLSALCLVMPCPFYTHIVAAQKEKTIIVLSLNAIPCTIDMCLSQLHSRVLCPFKEQQQFSDTSVACVRSPLWIDSKKNHHITTTERQKSKSRHILSL